MEDIQTKEQFNQSSGQIIIYYPFRFTETSENNKTKTIKTTTVSIEKGIEIYHDDFIKLVDTENSKDAFKRELYTVALGNIDELSNKIYQPKFDSNNNDSAFNDFVKMIKEKDAEKKSETDPKPQILKTNIVLYKKTHIGILELFLSYTFDENEDCEKSARAIADTAGKLKKLFFIDDNDTEYSKRNAEAKKLVDNNAKTFVNYINNLKDVNIHIDEKDILFNCISGKKRAYSFCQLFVNQEAYEKQIKNKVNVASNELNIDQKEERKKEIENTIMLSLGRAHINDGRNFTNEVAERFRYEDENSCKHSITASSLGTLILCQHMGNYIYYMQHMQEQYVFVYELCLHQRFYLYTVIEDYRNTEQNYYAIKSNFTEMITRYNLSLISEVEPQAVYTRIRQAMNIEAITKDAEKALDMLQAKEETKKELESERFSRLLSILGLVMTALNLITFVMVNNVVNLTKLLIALLILAIGIIAWIRPYKKRGENKND